MALPTAVYTSNPVHVYEFVWTVYNFSRTPALLQGPSFSPIPGSSSKFSYQLNCASNYIGLIFNHLDNLLPNLNMSSDITFIHSDGKIWIQNSTAIQKVTSSMYLINVSYIGKKCDILKALKSIGDKLIVKGKLSFSGYDISSSIYIPVENSSEQHGELLKELKNMYEKGCAHDITFSLGSKQLHAHKAILCSRSPVFSKMLLHDMVEKNSNSIVIKEIIFHVFNCFLVFLYTGVVEDKEWNTVISLYSAADKYQVDSLRKACSSILCNSLAIDSVCQVLELSDLHNDGELKEAAKSFIQKNFTLVVNISEWDVIIATKPKLASEVLGGMKTLCVV